MIKNIDVIFRKPYNYCNLRKIIYHQYLPMLIGIFDQMGAQSDRLRCEVCQNLFLRPMNTGFLRHAVATALTVYGIETFLAPETRTTNLCVATALTVYGIETLNLWIYFHNQMQVATALTVYGIETITIFIMVFQNDLGVATALTVYGMRRRVRDSRGAKRR